MGGFDPDERIGAMLDGRFAAFPELNRSRRAVAHCLPRRGCRAPVQAAGCLSEDEFAQLPRYFSRRFDARVLVIQADAHFAMNPPANANRTSSTTFRVPVLFMMLARWMSTVRTLMPSRWAIALLVRPLLT